MQAEYKKEWMDTYLWVLSEHAGEHYFEEQMLLHNPGNGRLEFLKQEKDGEEYFCYKVTGKKALSSIYAAFSIGERQIREILRQIFYTLEGGREYLLAEEDFVLAPNYIFASFPQMTLEFCYVPGYGVPLQEQLEGLFEYLLNRVDYDDKKAVSLLYDCYMFCMQEKGGLAEIKKRLEAEEVEKKGEAAEQPVEKNPESSLELGTGEAVLLPEASGKGWKEDLEKKESPTSYVSWLTDRLFHRKKREVLLVAEEQEEYSAGPGVMKWETEAVQGKEPDRTERMEPDSGDMERTVLLSARESSTVPVLVCDRTGEVIPLNRFPFYIGSAVEYTNYVPEGNDISRMHCCISKKLDNYYLSDLNSTNGTYHNQKEIVPGKEQLLAANDEIRIASQIFYIKFPCH